MKQQKMGVYIHVPFCVRKCLYCDFLSFPVGTSVWENDTGQKASGNAASVCGCGVNDGKMDSYVTALLREIEAGMDRLPAEAKQGVSETGKQLVDTVFFGGGTPSLLSGEQLTRIMDALRRVYEITVEAEITLEANPGTVTAEKLAAFKKAGVNRLSFGLQSAQNGELKQIGRIHTWEDFQESFRLAREAGFDNINIDLMSALPGQTIDSWKDTMEKVLALAPEHISAYSLIIEEGTPFYEKYGEPEGKLFSPEECLPEEKVERQMYHMTKETLREKGYFRYEISNYAKAGFECRHNVGYWKRKPYLGLGLGASSCIGETRFRNLDNFDDYIAEWECADRRNRAAVIPVEKLTVEDQMAETMFLGLRLTEGVDEQEFLEKFGRSVDDIYGRILAEQESKRLILREDGHIRLTEYGVDVSNQVFYEYLLD